VRWERQRIGSSKNGRGVNLVAVERNLHTPIRSTKI
jgi:hypothetical protein